MGHEFTVAGTPVWVDFSYSVNGEMYDFSLPGGGFVSFTDLIEVLGIISDTYNEETEEPDASAELALDVTVSDATRRFVKNVENVEFSNPALLDVSKVEEDTTVGQIKEARGLQPEYSAELTEEEIETINGTSVSAGDWALISLQPFESEEELTATMKNGEQFVIRVTDAQIKAGSDLRATLDGKEFVLVAPQASETWVETWEERTLKAVLTTTPHNQITSAHGNYDAVRFSEDNVASYPKWEFEFASDGKYYISNNGKYLNINESTLSLTNTRQALKVESRGDNIFILNDDKYSLTLYGNAIDQGFGGYRDNDGNPGGTVFSLYSPGARLTFDAADGMVRNQGLLNGAGILELPVESENAEITLPTESEITLPSHYLASDGSINYMLTGWYCVGNKQTYNLNTVDKITLDSSMKDATGNYTFYAVYEVKSYDFGGSGVLGGLRNGAVENATITSSAVKVDMWDISPLFNMKGLTQDSDGDLNDDQTKFLFIDEYSGYGSPVFPERQQNINRWTGHTMGNGYNTVDGLFPAAINAGVFDKSGNTEGVTYLGNAKNGSLYWRQETDLLFDYGNNQMHRNLKGYYIYDSDKAAAAYNRSEQKFYVYKDAQYFTADGEASRTGFLPLNVPEGSYRFDDGSINYHFAMRTEVDFFLTADVGTGGNKMRYDPNDPESELRDMEFFFSGDDDVWVLVDGQVVLDLGGIHSRIEGSINFSTGEIRRTDPTDPNHKTKTIGQLPNLTAGNHTLEVYYLERGGNVSNNLTAFLLIPFIDLNVDKIEYQTDKAVVVNGAEFVLKKLMDDGSEKYVKAGQPNELGVSQIEYVDDLANATVYKADENGYFMIHNVTDGTYFLEESTPPKYHDGLPGRIRMQVENGEIKRETVRVVTDGNTELGLTDAQRQEFLEVVFPYQGNKHDSETLLKIKNYRKESPLELIKKDNAGNALEGVGFTIYELDDYRLVEAPNNINQDPRSGDGVWPANYKIVYEGTTGTDGKVVSYKHYPNGKGEDSTETNTDKLLLKAGCVYYITENENEYESLETPIVVYVTADGIVCLSNPGSDDFKLAVGNDTVDGFAFTPATVAQGETPATDAKMTVTNIVKQTVTVNKSWLNKDVSTVWPQGEEVEMTLYRVDKDDNNEEKLTKVEVQNNPVTLSAQQSSYTWDVPKLKSDGTEIQYVVKESHLDGYTAYVITDGTTVQSDTATAVPAAPTSLPATGEGETASSGLVASFLNHENESGKVNIEITKTITDADGKPIELVSDVTNKFTVYRSESNDPENHPEYADQPENVVDFNKGTDKSAYTKDYDKYSTDVSSYKPLDTKAEVTAKYVENAQDQTKNATTGSVYVRDLEAGMYTISEDKDSIPEKIYSKDGKVYQYKETVIATEYAWRGQGDDHLLHWSKTYGKDTPEDDLLIAIPEVGGAYKSTGNTGTLPDLFNGYLDFYVTNVYEEVEGTVTSETLDLELDKAWRNGNSDTPPTSGSVTFELHQVATTTITEAGENGGGSGGNDNNNSGSVKIYLYEGNGETLISQTYANPGDSLNIAFELTENKYIGVYRLGKYNEGQWGYEGQIYKNGDSTGTYTYTVSDNASGSIYFKFDNGITKDIFSGTPKFSSGSESGDDTDNTTSPGVPDPAGSGFPKTITLQHSDQEGNLWKHFENDLISKVVVTKGDTTETTTYSYYVVETGRSGLASAYSEPSITTKGSESNPISGADETSGEDNRISVLIGATNTVPNPDDKFITVKKTWLDEDGKELLNHPDEVKVDVWRVKLPDVIGSGGGVTYDYTPMSDVFKDTTSPTNPSGNGSTVQGDVVFQYKGHTYYVEGGYVNNRTFSADDIDKMIKGLDGNGSTGDFIIRLTDKVWDVKDFYTDGIIDDNHNLLLRVHNGDQIWYNGKLYVYKISSDFNGSGDNHGIIKERDKWHEIGQRNIIDTVDIELPDNKLLIDENSIRTQFLQELYDAVDKVLREKALTVTWSEEDKKLEPYKINGEQLTITIGTDDEWQTSFTAPGGYLYFFFEREIPGYTTLYRNEEHGVFDQKVAIEIVNQRPVGELDITKEWTGDGEQGDEVYVRILRKKTGDTRESYITSEIAANPEAYGLTRDQFINDGHGHYYLIIKKTDTDPDTGESIWETVKITDLPIADDEGNVYEYSVLEAGHLVPAHGDTPKEYHWGEHDTLTGYTTVKYTRNETINADGTKTVTYTPGTAEESTDASSKGVELGTVETVDGKNTYTNGQALVTVKNHTESTTDLIVQKRWMSGDKWNPDYGQEDTIWFKLYRVKGDQKEQVDSTIYHLTKINKVDVPVDKLGADTELVSKTFTLSEDEKTYSIPFMTTIPDLPVLTDGWEYAVVECDRHGNEFPGAAFSTCWEFDNTTLAIKNELTDVIAAKTWNDQDVSITHPAVTLRLYRTTDEIPDNSWKDETGYDHLTGINWGTPIKTATIAEGATEENDLKVTWSNLPKYDINTGKLYTYYVKEAPVDGYTLESRALVGGDKYHFTFQNKLDNTTDFEFSKIWKDISSLPTTWPENATITVTLNAIDDDHPNGGAIENVVIELTKDGNSTDTPAWTSTTSTDGKKTTFKVEGLAKYNSKGQEYSYYVVESQVAGYKAPSYQDKNGNGLVFMGGNAIGKASNGQTIVNTPEGGYELPSTGGIGTHLFYLLGSILVLGAGILLMRRKKLN